MKWKKNIALNNNYNIIVTDKFKQDFKYIFSYKIQYSSNLKSSKNIYSKIKNSILNLSYFPELYPKLNLNNKILRKIVITDYIIIYEVNKAKKEIYVLHMFYCKQDYLKLIY